MTRKNTQNAYSKCLMECHAYLHEYYPSTHHGHCTQKNIPAFSRMLKRITIALNRLPKVAHARVCSPQAAEGVALQSKET
jgi:hypothetical protein